MKTSMNHHFLVEKRTTRAHAHPQMGRGENAATIAKGEEQMGLLNSDDCGNKS